MTQSKLSLDASSRDDDRFVQRRLTTVGLWLMVDPSIALRQCLFPSESSLRH